MRKYLLAGISMVCLMWACTKPNPVESVERKLDWDAIADKLVERMDLQPGERVLLVAQPGRFDSLVMLLRQRIESKQGKFLGAISIDSLQPASWQTKFTRAVASLDSISLVEHFSSVDLGIMMPGATPVHTPYAVLQTLLKNGNGRTIHFHWSGAYDGSGNALELNDTIDQFYQNALLNTDYAALSQLQTRFENDIQHKWIEVTTLEGTVLRFQATGRPVTKQDGDASQARSREAKNLIDREVELPAGAIRVAPLEETVEGTIAFPPSLWNGEPVDGLVLTFESGKVVSVKATKGESAVLEELENGGEAARAFRELAVGFNPTLVPASGHTWIPYYGYGAGVVRLSLGDNSELGGNVRGHYVRWNFFTNATVRVGDEVWIEGGKMIKTQ